VRTATYASAATSFAALVHDIPVGAWDKPGLGNWDVRALVGHTSRSLTTVSTYLRTKAERVDIATPEEYYLRVTPSALGIDPAGLITTFDPFRDVAESQPADMLTADTPVEGRA